MMLISFVNTIINKINKHVIELKQNTNQNNIYIPECCYKIRTVPKMVHNITYDIQLLKNYVSCSYIELLNKLNIVIQPINLCEIINEYLTEKKEYKMLSNYEIRQSDNKICSVSIYITPYAINNIIISPEDSIKYEFAYIIEHNRVYVSSHAMMLSSQDYTKNDLIQRISEKVKDIDDFNMLYDLVTIFHFRIKQLFDNIQDSRLRMFI
jgi:hypothetical protein